MGVRGAAGGGGGTLSAPQRELAAGVAFARDDLTAEIRRETENLENAAINIADRDATNDEKAGWASAMSLRAARDLERNRGADFRPRAYVQASNGFRRASSLYEQGRSAQAGGVLRGVRDTLAEYREALKTAPRSGKMGARASAELQTLAKRAARLSKKVER